MARAIPKKRLTKKDIKAKADRAEKKSKGEEVKAEASPLEPEVGTKKRGRPSKYDPAFCDDVIESGMMGASKAQMARNLGIDRETLDNWAKAHPEFSRAVKAAQELSLAWWEDQGQSSLWADKFQSTSYIFQMKNRFRDDYADVSRTEHTGRDGGAIEIADPSRTEEARRVAFALGRVLERQRMKVIDGEVG